MTILIVDDSARVRSLLRRVVQPFASLVLEAASGAEALDRYRERLPAVVLMDINMPGMDGLSAMRAIRALDPDARVVIVTDYDDPETRLEAQSAGARAFVSKRDITALEAIFAEML